MALTIAPDMVPTFVRDFTISQYFQGATMSCLVYDTLITLDREAKHFWSSPKKLVSIVFFTNRYSGIFGEIARIVYYTYSNTREVCKCAPFHHSIRDETVHVGKFAMWTRVASDLLTIVLIDYMLMIRVIALYSRAKFVTFVLQMLLITEAILMFGMMVHISLAEGLTVKALAKGLTVCGETNNVIGFGITWWSIPMVYSVVLFLLALYKAIAYWKENRGFEGATLIKVLIQDQIIYFVLAIACNFLNVLEFKLRVSNGLLSALLDTLGSPAFLCIFGSRMLLNLKEAAERGNNSADHRGLTQETEMSAIQFS